MIVLKDITKIFNINNSLIRVIDNINLSINRGEIFGLVGETGSGKSTILRLMNGFIKADEGQVYLMGEKLDRKSKYRLVKDTSMIFQSFNLLGNLNVIENVILPARLRKGDRLEDLKRAREILSFVGLGNFEGAYIRNLSGGEKQRVAIARTLMIQPKIIFCDEPTSALDENMTYEILKLLRDINKEFGTTIALVSHDISVIKALCNRVAIIENGKIANIIGLKAKELRPISYKEALVYD